MRFVFFKRVVFLVVLMLVFGLGVCYAAKKKRQTTVSCRAVLFSDATKGKRLYSKQETLKVLPASTTKVMTAILVMERLSLDQYVTVHRAATLVQPSRINVRPGEKYKVRDLLYAMLLNSANDASVVLAQAVAGSEANFVNLMNRRAYQLGAKSTRFTNSNGLPTKVRQYTTAYDMYLIFRQALKYPFFRQAIRLHYMTITSSTGRRIGLKSHNKILFSDWKKKIYGKTGYTRSAGACFVGTVAKGNSDLIIAVFDCDKRWDYIKRMVSRYGGLAL